MAESSPDAEVARQLAILAAKLHDLGARAPVEVLGQTYTLGSTSILEYRVGGERVAYPPMYLHLVDDAGVALPPMAYSLREGRQLLIRLQALYVVARLEKRGDER